MTKGKKRLCNKAAALFLTLTLALSGMASVPLQAFADDAAPGPVLGDIWVVPEVIGGARVSAEETMLAWVTFDYSYYGNELADDLDPADFTLQMKTRTGDWTDYSGANIGVFGGEEYYVAYFEAIVAASVPANTDPYVKKWRVVYEPDGADPLISEIVVQGAALEETDDVTAFNKEYCADFRVEQVPWSYEEYQSDHIPPVYVAYVYPDVITSFGDPGLTKSEGASHSIVLSNVGVWDYDNGAGLGSEDMQTTGTDLRLGNTDEDNGGIAGLVDFWNLVRDGEYWFDWPGSSDAPLPGAEALYNKLASVACVPDENADEYLSYVVDGTNVFWISGASSEEAVSHGVSDHILVVVRDWEAYGTSKHDWSGAPEWEWAGSDETGYTAAMANFKCANHEGHVSRAAAVIRVTENDEQVTYTATASFNGRTYRDTKTVPVAEEEEEPLPAPPAPAAPAAATSEAAVNSATVNADTIQQALQAAGGTDTLVLGSAVKKISKGAFKGTGVKTLIVKSRKLKKKTVKGSLKGSSVKTVKIQIGSKKTNKKYVKKYKKFFTKKNAGKKVKVK